MRWSASAAMVVRLFACLDGGFLAQRVGVALGLFQERLGVELGLRQQLLDALPGLIGGAFVGAVSC